MEIRMLSSLLAQKENFIATNWPFLVGAVGVFIFIFFLVILFSFFNLWIQALFTGAKVGFLDLIGMKLRKVDYSMIVRQKIALVQAGVKVDNTELEAHYLARGNVP